MSNKRNRYPDQFKREAVELVKMPDRPVNQIANELGISDQTLRNWVSKAEGPTTAGLPVDEREELKALRKENKTLRMEREILKKAAAFFAKETDNR